MIIENTVDLMEQLRNYDEDLQVHLESYGESSQGLSLYEVDVYRSQSRSVITGLLQHSIQLSSGQEVGSSEDVREINTVGDLIEELFMYGESLPVELYAYDESSQSESLYEVSIGEDGDSVIISGGTMLSY